MKNSLKISSLTAFLLSIPSLIIVDWYYKSFGILVMFTFITIGLVLDQITRMLYPDGDIVPIENYQKSRFINMVILVLFLQSPMALIYGNKASDKLGFWMMIIMIVFGIILSQIARLKFRYTVEKGEKTYD